MPLTGTQARNAKPNDRAYKLFDSEGLFLLVQPNGTKLWPMKYRFAGKEKLLSFGAYPAVGISVVYDFRDDLGPLLNRSHVTNWALSGSIEVKRGRWDGEVWANHSVQHEELVASNEGNSARLAAALVRSDALGRPLAFHLTVGEAADCKAYDALIGLPERAPEALLATRCDQLANSFLGMVHLATPRYWLKFVHAA